MENAYEKFFEMKNHKLTPEDMKELQDMHEKLSAQKYPHVFITPEACAINGNTPAVMTLLTAFISEFVKELKQNPILDAKIVIQECVDMAFMSEKELLQKTLDMLKQEREEV